MSWNTSLLGGPWNSAGEPWPGTGAMTFVLPTSEITPALQAYATAVPAGVPVLAGVDCQALTFPDLTTAQGPLAAYWMA